MRCVNFFWFKFLYDDITTIQCRDEVKTEGISENVIRHSRQRTAAADRALRKLCKTVEAIDQGSDIHDLSSDRECHSNSGDTWLRIGGVTLTLEDKDVLTGEEWLNN